MNALVVLRVKVRLVDSEAAMKLAEWVQSLVARLGLVHTAFDEPTMSSPKLRVTLLPSVPMP